MTSFLVVGDSILNLNLIERFRVHADVLQISSTTATRPLHLNLPVGTTVAEAAQALRFLAERPGVWTGEDLAVRVQAERG